MSLLSAVGDGVYDDLSQFHTLCIHDMCRHLYHDPWAATYAAGCELIL